MYSSGVFACVISSALTAFVILAMYPLKRATEDDLSVDYAYMASTPDDAVRDLLGQDLGVGSCFMMGFFALGLAALVAGYLVNLAHVPGDNWFVAAIVGLCGGVGFGMGLMNGADRIRNNERCIRVVREKGRQHKYDLMRKWKDESEAQIYKEYGKISELNKRIAELEEAVELRQSVGAEQAFLGTFARFCTKVDPLRRSTQDALIHQFRTGFFLRDDPTRRELVGLLERSQHPLVKKILNGKPSLPLNP